MLSNRKTNRIKPGNLVAWNGTQIVPATANNNNIIGVATSSSGFTYTGTGTVSVSSGRAEEEPKRKKRIFKCKTCRKVLAEYYSPYSAGEGKEIKCKTCHQIDKLTE